MCVACVLRVCCVCEGPFCVGLWVFLVWVRSGVPGCLVAPGALGRSFFAWDCGEQRWLGYR